MSKPDPPKPPDFQAQAQAQGAANLAGGAQTSVLSNPNIIGPTGTRTITGGPTVGFDRPTVTETLSPEQQAIFDAQNRISQGVLDVGEAGLGRVGQTFAQPYDPSGLQNVYQPSLEGQPSLSGIDPSQLQQVTPLNAQGLPDLTGIDPSALQDVQNINLGELDPRQTQAGVAGRNAVTEALIAREAPRFERQREQTRNRLLTQGFNPGTEGFTEATDELSRAENDFRLAAQLAGGQEQSRLFGLESQLREQGLNEQQIRNITQQSLRGLNLGEQQAAGGLNLAARGQEFGERATTSQFEAQLRQQGLSEQQVQSAVNLMNRQQGVNEQFDLSRLTGDQRARQLQEELSLRNLPLNEINALRTGSQAQIPQFQQFSGSTVGPAPVFDAALAQGNFAQQNYQNQLAAGGGAFDLGGALLQGAGAAGGFGNLFSF